MKRLIFLCLFFVVIAAALYPNEQPKWMTLLISLRSERRVIELSLSSIESELRTTKAAINEMKKELLQMQTASDEQRQLWNESKKAVEERKLELEKERKLLIEQQAESARLEKQLLESAGLLTNLRQSFDDYQAEAESQIEALELGTTLLGIGIIVAGGVAVAAIIVAIVK